MPSPERQEYNPDILGFIENRGPVIIPLQKARTLYGKLPSEYKFVPEKSGRKHKKGLNLDLGKLVTEMFAQGPFNLKSHVFSFFKSWHRDWENEFNLDMEPFFNLNYPGSLKSVISRNRKKLESISGMGLRSFLEKQSLIRKDILNSIPEVLLPGKAETILSRKVKRSSSCKNRKPLEASLCTIRSFGIIQNTNKITGIDFSRPDPGTIEIYSDEISKTMISLSKHIHISGLETLEWVKGDGVEFEFAARDVSYLDMGKDTGDCTSNKTTFQTDRNIENIYWTVFPWILDRNYQILKVFFQGEFVMKIHLLPVYIIGNDKSQIALAVDAVETTRPFRDDMIEHKRDDLINNKKLIFFKALEKIKSIAKSMGTSQIYAEKFSNTGWVRDEFESFGDIFLNVNNIIKIDEMEDVFCFCRSLFNTRRLSYPEEIFMEMQMKNTSLLPCVTKKTAAIKSFAIVMGGSGNGIPMKKVIGI